MTSDSVPESAALRERDSRLKALRERGAALLQQGLLRESADAYEDVLREQPEDPEAIQGLGCVAAHAGAYERAIELFDRCLALTGGNAAVLYQRAAALLFLGRFERAIPDFDRFLELVPNHPMAHELRGRARAAAGQESGARADFERVSRLAPVAATAVADRAKALVALACDGLAVEECDAAIRLQPTLAAAHATRAAALFHLARFDDALAAGQRAVSLDPESTDGNFACGAVLVELGRAAEALRYFDGVLARNPHAAVVHDARVGALLDLLRPEDALQSADRALEIDPGYAEAHSNRGLVLSELGRIREALASYDRAIALAPQFAPARRNKALACLLLGDFEAGWPLYEARERVGQPQPVSPLLAPRWSGREELRGRTIYIQPEQGLGDTVQFCRYARVLEAHGASVVLGVPSQLVALVRTLSSTVAVLPHTEAPVRCDFYVPLLSLPLAFQTTVATVPGGVPYLSAEEPRVAAWRARLGAHGFRVGISWQGRSGRGDRGRSFPVHLFHQLAQVPGVRLISLQKNEGEAQLDRLPEGLAIERPGVDFDAGPDAFLDTAAVMNCLDLVISSDTATLHLAGALGRPAWAVLRNIPDWRWMLDRNDSPWYPTMRLFRQPERGDWQSVFLAMAGALADAASAARVAGRAQPG